MPEPRDLNNLSLYLIALWVDWTHQESSHLASLIQLQSDGCCGWSHLKSQRGWMYKMVCLLTCLGWKEQVFSHSLFTWLAEASFRMVGCSPRVTGLLTSHQVLPAMNIPRARKQKPPGWLRAVGRTILTTEFHWSKQSQALPRFKRVGK